MPNLGMGEILILLVLALLVFGARRLPEVGASLGKGIREFKRSLNEAADAINAPLDETPRVPPAAGSGSGRTAEPPGGEPKRLSE